MPERAATKFLRGLLAYVLILVWLAQAPIVHAQKPYDDKLLRLSEILGAVHYLRELCGSGDGQLWRDRMKELMDAEGSSAVRKAQLARRFNQGYQSYSRTYSNCTPSAKTAVGRFLDEGVKIADGLVATQAPKPAPKTANPPAPPAGGLQ